jgi:Fur family transcriptional regulator, ferric uptake regulator
VTKSKPGVDSVLDTLKLRGYRMTPQRRAIIEEILSSNGHVSAIGIAEKLAKKMPGVNASTVYRTLDLLEGIDIVSHSHLGSGAEYHLTGEHEHVHLVCSNCGRTQSLSLDELEPFRKKLAKDHDFQPDFTHFAIAGLCSRCHD